jgi:multiple sugar transport system substrate-binding protein
MSPLPFHGPSVDRRTAIKGAFAMAAGLAAVPGLAACGSGGGNTNTGSATGLVTFGSNAAGPQQTAYAKVFAAAKQAVGVDVKVNAVDHNTFQNTITTYLQSNPQDVFTWFSGERMRFFAQQGLCAQLDDVWDKIGANYTDAMKAQSKGSDGHYYIVPFDYYPWAVFYRKSLFQAKGYTEPKTWDQFVALAKQMQKDGLIPLSFPDSDQWPAMGTFDYINLRLNGYEFHEQLMSTGQGWSGPKVKAVFDQWRELLPYYSPGALSMTWQQGAAQLVTKKAGMIVLGLDQIGTVFTGGSSPADDLGFFAFPEIDPANGQDTVEAPIDGMMMPRSPKHGAAGKTLLEFMGKASTQQLWLATDPADIAAATGADTSKYTPPQTASLQLISSAKHLSQFLDRDTRADFGDPKVGPALQSWYNNPSDVTSILKNLDQEAKVTWATAG